MNKKLLIIGGFIALAIGSILYLAGTAGAPTNQRSQTQTTNSSADEPLSQNAQPGVYRDYSESELANAAGQTVLFFHAPWCPQCRSIESGIKAQGVPEGITILKVDYDSNQALRQKYGVTIQTTFVKVDGNGTFISKYVAYDEPTFDAVKQNYL